MQWTYHINNQQRCVITTNITRSNSIGPSPTPSGFGFINLSTSNKSSTAINLFRIHLSTNQDQTSTLPQRRRYKQYNNGATQL